MVERNHACKTYLKEYSSSSRFNFILIHSKIDVEKLERWWRRRIVCVRQVLPVVSIQIKRPVNGNKVTCVFNIT